MRKHFLILMLLALLPFTAWADDLGQGKIVIASTYYGHAPSCDNTADSDIKVYNKVNERLTKGTDFTFDGFFSDAACNNALTEAEVKALDALTTVYVKVTGINNYENPQSASFEIKKMPLVILGEFVTGKDQKAFGADDPTGPIFTVTKVYKKNDTAFATDIKATLGDIFTFERESGEDAGDYDLIATITDNTVKGNYTVESEDIYTTLPVYTPTPAAGVVAQFVINPKAFTLGSTAPVTPATITITIDDTNLIYNGTNQKPTITVHDIALDKDLVLDTDYTVTYAATYSAATDHNITITGKGNYETSGIAQTFTIAPRPVFVKPVFKKVYDGTTTLPALPTQAQGYVVIDAETPNADGIYTYKFVFQGLIDAAASDVVFDNTALKDNNLSTTQKDVTTSPVALKFVCAEGKNINHVFTLANYTFIAQDGTLEITQRPVTVTAASSTINYGESDAAALKLIDDDATSTPTVDDALVGAVFTQAAQLRYIIKVTKASAAETTGANKGKYKLTPEWLTDSEIDTKVNAITAATYNALMGTTVTSVSTAQKTALKAALKALKADYNMTAVFGYLGYNKATLYLGLDESKFTLSKVYDGTEISLDDQLSKLTDPTNLSFSGFQGSDKATDANIIDLSGLTLEVLANGEAANTYNLSLSGAKSDYYNIAYVNSVYKITKRPIKLTIAEQTFQKGTVPTIAQNYTIELIDGVDADKQGVVEGQDVKDVFVLGFATDDPAEATYDATNYVQFNGDGEITTAADVTFNTGFGIIAVDPATEGSVFANYNFIYSAGSGKVKIIAATGYLVLNDKSDLTGLAAGAANVILDTDRQIQKNVWASLVLPFNTTVRKVSHALGYAVVDMFVEDPNSDAMNFKLHMGAIPAYTPFLVKTDETINLNAVVFEDVTIVALDEDTEANLTKSNKSYNFIGCMNFDEVGSDYWSDGSNMTEESIQFNKYKSTRKQRALKAYITAKPGVSEAPIINIEEPDGTTSIHTLTANGEMVPAQGWYTLNGVKLNAAPAEKGIYINNGKKVVIK